MTNLNNLEIYTGAEASKILGKDNSYIRQLYAKYPNRFPEGSIRKFGKEYIVTKEAIEELLSAKKVKVDGTKEVIVYPVEAVLNLAGLLRRNRNRDDLVSEEEIGELIDKIYQKKQTIYDISDLKKVGDSTKITDSAYVDELIEESINYINSKNTTSAD